MSAVVTPTIVSRRPDSVEFEGEGSGPVPLPLWAAWQGPTPRAGLVPRPAVVAGEPSQLCSRSPGYEQIPHRWAVGGEDGGGVRQPFAGDLEELGEAAGR